MKIAKICERNARMMSKRCETCQKDVKYVKMSKTCQKYIKMMECRKNIRKIGKKKSKRYQEDVWQNFFTSLLSNFQRSYIKLLNNITF